MDFKEATDVLLDVGVTADEIGEALGLAGQTVRAMRLDPSSPSYRRPPDDWRLPIARLLMKREKELGKIMDRFKREMGE